MLDIGWSELLVIGVVALIVVGPKDLPGMFRTLGRMTAKARGMAREFSRAMEDAARESGMDEVSRDLKAVTSKKSLGLDALERAADRFDKWEPKLPGQTPNSAASPAAATGAAAAAEPLPGAPAIVEPTIAAPARDAVRGPATQALAEARAAEVAGRKAAVGRPKPEETATEAIAETPVRRIPKARGKGVVPDPAAPAPDPSAKPAAKKKPAKAKEPKADKSPAKADKPRKARKTAAPDPAAPPPADTRTAAPDPDA